MGRKMMGGMEQRELVFHDTVPLPEDQIPEARSKASRQKELILGFFKSRPEERFTPIHIHSKYEFHFGSILLTSVRRSISDLTKEGRLIKCQWDERRDELYGKPNRTWKYNIDYVAPLTYKGHKVYTADEINSICITDVEFE